MEGNRVKRAIYLRIFAGLLAVYVVLMAGFSVYSIRQWDKVERLEFFNWATQNNSNIDRILRNHLDSENRIADLAKLRMDLAPISQYNGGRELALYTGDYDPVYSTNDFWIVGFAEFADGKTDYFGQAYLNPQDWFSEEEVAELEAYLSADPKPRQAGDLVRYKVDLQGFWLDQEMIVPNKIVATPIYAEEVKDDGWVVSSRWGKEDQVVYAADPGNTDGLPYFKQGTVNHLIYRYKYQPSKERQAFLRNLVLDREKMQEHIEQGQIGSILVTKPDLLTYRYYMVLPYQNRISGLGDKAFYSDFWTVIADEVNLWEKNAGTLLFVWLSSLLTFVTVAWILARQTYRTYQKGEELERHRRELTYALAHDLKTPLSIISGYAQNLMENVHTEKRKHYAAGIRDKVDRMDRIIREMLDLFRLEAEARPITRQEVDLSVICREIVGRYEDLCRERSIKVLLEGDRVIKADPALIKRVIDNFFVNALAHTPPNGVIRIGISGDTLELYNSGSRIPAEKMADIWQPFQKADNSRRNTKGTGLGLAIARRILEAHQYSYGVKNTEDGVVFWFKFA